MHKTVAENKNHLRLFPKRFVMKLTVRINTESTAQKLHSNLPEGGTNSFFKEQNIFSQTMTRNQKGFPPKTATPAMPNALTQRAPESCLLGIQWFASVLVQHSDNHSRCLRRFTQSDVKCVSVLKHLCSYCSTNNMHSADRAKHSAFCRVIRICGTFFWGGRCTRASVAAVVSSGKPQQAVCDVRYYYEWTTHTQQAAPPQQ